MFNTMEKTTVRFIILGAMLFFASIAQCLDVTVFGVAPNAVLVMFALAVLFLRDGWHELFLLSCTSFLLKFSPVANREIVAFFIVGLLMIAVVRKLPWHLFVNGMFLIIGATAAMYALIDPASINSLMFAQELGYNIILMYVLYYGLMLVRPFRSMR
jgi:hypothetical protein